MPECYIFKGSEMKELNVFAELNLTFSHVLANVLQVNATLYQLHSDKTASANIEFDKEFLVPRYILRYGRKCIIN